MKHENTHDYQGKQHHQIDTKLLMANWSGIGILYHCKGRWITLNSGYGMSQKCLHISLTNAVKKYAMIAELPIINDIKVLLLNIEKF